MKLRTALFVLITLCLLACGTQPTTALKDGYQLFTAADGRVYRIEYSTGRTMLLEGSSYKEVSELAMPQLTLGKVYRAEDGKTTFRYSGNGKFEPWGIDRYNLPDSPHKK